MHTKVDPCTHFIFMLDQAINEMRCNQTKALATEMLADKKEFYEEMYKELKKAKSFLREGGSKTTTYRYLQMNIFFKYETFFMDLFDTNLFPCLFELFEFE